MKTKEQQAKDYAEKIPYYQDRKQHAVEDFSAGWDAAVKYMSEISLKKKTIIMEEIKKLTIPEGYEFDKVEKGEVILKKIEVTLPDTWEECYMKVPAKYLSHFRYEFAIPEELVTSMGALCQLLICRNAWWKMLGWKPDWENESDKYCIYNNGGDIDAFPFNFSSRILAFPDMKIASQFYETFKDLIEEAKELL